MEITALESLSVEDRSLENDLAVYPNPASSIITVSGEELVDLQILSIEGKVIYQYDCTAEGMQVDISNLPNGLYLIQASSEQEKYYRKLI